jgi:superfamily II DNA or RNA helicase
MQVEILNSLYVGRDQISSKELAEIAEAFSYPNPVFEERTRLGLSTWGIPNTICLYGLGREFLTLPRGTLGTLARMFPGRIEIQDRTVEVPVTLPDPGFALKNFQQSLTEQALMKNQGVLIAPCGSGKTVVGIHLILKRRQRTLWLTHTLDLAEQFRSRLREFTGIEAGLIGNGIFDDRHDVVAALVQSLSKPLPESFVGSFGQVIIDECHHQSCKTFDTVVSQLPAKYRLGLSASKVRRDRMEFLAYATLGPVIAELGRDVLEGCSEVMQPIIRAVMSNSYFPDVQTHNDMLKLLTRDENRNELVANLVEREAKAGRCSFVLSSRIDHLEKLHKILTNQCPEIRSEMMTGKDTGDHRERCLADMNSGELRVLFSTIQLLSEGVDVRRADRLFLTTPIRSPELVKQAVGRICRTLPGKGAPEVFDIVDEFVPLALSQWRTRKAHPYRGYRIVEENIGHVVQP